MATSKEAVVLLLDVGANMALPANDRGDTYLDLALEGIQWIMNRKVAFSTYFSSLHVKMYIPFFRPDSTLSTVYDC